MPKRILNTKWCQHVDGAGSVSFGSHPWCCAQNIFLASLVGYLVIPKVRQARATSTPIGTPKAPFCSQKHLSALTKTSFGSLLEQVGTAFEFHLIWFVSCRRFGPEFWSKSGSKLHPPFLLLFFKLCFFKNLFTNQHLFRSHTNANVALGVVSASPMETCRRTKYMYVCRRGEIPTKHINSLLSFRR